MEINSEEKEQRKWVTLRSFQFETKAAILAAKLESVGIPTFIADSFAANAFPIGEGGIRLQVPEKSLSHAKAVEYEFNKSFEDNAETDFREFTKEDIAYQKELTQGAKGKYNWLFIPLAIVVVLVLLRAVGRALGVFPEVGGPF